MPYYSRTAEKQLQQYIQFFSVVGVIGPRQSGKSCMLQQVLDDYEYVSFDSATIRRQFYDDPEKFMRIYADKVIFDEVQKVPEIFDAVKLLVDEDRDRAGKFVLSGSSQFSMMKSISESLAGRIGLLTLLPFQLSEVPAALRWASVYSGSYPELINKNYMMKEDWYAAYLDTYLTRDVRDFGRIGDIRAFQQLISLLAGNAANQLNLSRYATELGVTVKTISNWLSILEASYIVHLLRPYYENFGKRVVKSPKIYFYDTGLLAYLTGVENQQQFESGPMTGALFENFVVIDILKQQKHQNTKANLYYLRTSNGVEIDLIIDYKSRKEFIEIKSGETFRSKMLASMIQFMQNGDSGYLLYRGKPVKAEKSIKIMNYQDYLLKPVE